MNEDARDRTGGVHGPGRRARRERGLVTHPGAETLTAYHAGELAPAAADDLQEHLTVCPECARLLLDLPDFLASPSPVAAADHEADAGWRDLRQRLPLSAMGAGRPPRPWAISTRTPAGRGRLLTAALLALAVGLPVGWLLGRRSGSPALPLEYVTIEATDVRRGGAEPPTPATVHREAVASTLILHLAKEPVGPFRLEIQPAGAYGRPATVPADAIYMLDTHTLLLTLTKGELAPGRYTLRIVDSAHPAADPLGEFALLVAGP
jgi:hypothetical protein